jgi:hypothetical protein
LVIAEIDESLILETSSNPPDVQCSHISRISVGQNEVVWGGSISSHSSHCIIGHCSFDVVDQLRTQLGLEFFHHLNKLGSNEFSPVGIIGVLGANGQQPGGIYLPT